MQGAHIGALHVNIQFSVVKPTVDPWRNRAGRVTSYSSRVKVHALTCSF